MDREELDTLITALTNCESAEDGACPEDCPMKDDEWKREGRAACRALVDDEIIVPAALIRRTVALLQAQEPRVMTLWEAVGIIDRPVYLERNVLMPDKSVNRQECYALVCATDDDHMIRLATPYGEEKWHVGAYGIGWRCWTSRPTDEQREAVKWE